METQFNELWSHMTKEKLKIQFLWLDIEEAKYWYSDKNLNQMKFEQLLGAAKAKNAAFGLYTSKNNWSEIFGLDYALKNLPVLFYPRYGVATDCSDFQRMFNNTLFFDLSFLHLFPQPTQILSRLHFICFTFLISMLYFPHLPDHDTCLFKSTLLILAFAGFTKPLLHQFYGDRTTPCNIDHDMSVYC